MLTNSTTNLLASGIELHVVSNIMATLTLNCMGWRIGVHISSVDAVLHETWLVGKLYLPFTTYYRPAHCQETNEEPLCRHYTSWSYFRKIFQRIINFDVRNTSLSNNSDGRGCSCTDKFDH